MKISLQVFMQSVIAIADEGPSYRLGHDGSDGLCDCVGLIIGAIRRSGGTWDGIHGSNYAARQEVDYLLPVTEAEDLSVGEVVFKASMPGQGSYNLPDRYSEDPDRRDYYHVGVVCSVDPLCIVHCTGPGIVVDDKLGKWSYRGWLRKVAREGEAAMTDVRTGKIVALTGSTVNLRKTPDGDLVDRIPVGATVTVIARRDGWARVSYDGKSGWLMERFMQVDGEDLPAQGDDADTVTVCLPRDVAEMLRDALGGAVGWG